MPCIRIIIFSEYMEVQQTQRGCQPPTYSVMPRSPAPEAHAALKQRIATLEDENARLVSKMLKWPFVINSHFLFFQLSDLCLWSSAVSIHMYMRDEPSTGLWASPTPLPTWLLSMTGVLCRRKTRVSLISWNQLRSKYGMVCYQYSAPWVILYYGREACTFRSYEKLIQWYPLVVGLTQGNGSTDDLALICQEVCQQQIRSALEIISCCNQSWREVLMAHVEMMQTHWRDRLQLGWTTKLHTPSPSFLLMRSKGEGYITTSQVN